MGTTTSHGRFWRMCLAAASTLLLAPVSAGGQPPLYEFVRSDLTRVTGELIDLDESGVTYADGRGTIQTIDADGFLGLVTASQGDLPGTSAMWANRVRVRPGLVRLVDGQRLTGTPSMIRSDDEVMSWDHPVLGLVDIPLERIDRVQQNRSIVGSRVPAIIGPAQSADVLLLINGDRLEGFLTSIGANAGFEIDGAAVTVPIADVDQIAMANPSESLEGSVVWLADGSVIAAPGLTIAGGVPTLAQSDAQEATEAGVGNDPEPRQIILDPSTLRAFVREAGALVPLASVSKSAGLRIEEESAAFNAEPIVLPRPMTARFELPDGASWLSFDAELPLRARTWGHASLTVLADGTQAASIELSPGAPNASVRIELHGATILEIVLEPGGFGPVQVMAVLRDALIAVDR